MNIPILIHKLNRNYNIVYVVLLISLGYIAFLACSIHEGVFYAGDQALKALQVKQIAAGFGYKYLHLTQPEWVRSIWQAGYFPLKPPFVYPSAKGYMIVYPPMFQIITSIFYAKLGSTGLYILPLLSTLTLLGWTCWLLKRCGIAPFNMAVGIFILVFCSPLMLYGVMFWEHLPAVLLLFAGLSFIVSTPSKVWAAVAMGLISGMAIWLRPEALMMNLLYCAAAGVLYFREGKTGRVRRTVYIGFVAAEAFSVLPWFAFNLVNYGSIFGIHAMQVLTDNNPQTRIGWSHGFHLLLSINYLSVRNFFFIALLIPVLYRLIRRREATDLRLILLTGIVLLFSLVTPFILPNDGWVQWGPRYFLAVIPIVLIVLLLVEKKWDMFAHWKVPLWLSLIIIAGSAENFYHNTRGGGLDELRWRYSERLSGEYDVLNRTSGNVVIVSPQWVSYDFGYLFDKDYFFAESGDDSLRRLLPLLKEHGVHQIIYIFDPRKPTLPKMLKDPSTCHYWDDAAKKGRIRNDLASVLYKLD
jgi:hypothetical protein